MPICTFTKSNNLSTSLAADQHNEREDLRVRVVLAGDPLRRHRRQPLLSRLRHDDTRDHKGGGMERVGIRILSD